MFNKGVLVLAVVIFVTGCGSKSQLKITTEPLEIESKKIQYTDPDWNNPQIKSLAVHSSTAEIFPQHTNGGTDKFIMHVRHMGDPGSLALINQINTPLTWPVSQFTGFLPLSPIANYQRGFIDTHGSNAFQSQGSTVAGLINTNSFLHTQPITGGGPHFTLEYAFSKPEPLWVKPTSSLTLQAHMAIPFMQATENAVGQLCFFVYLQDTVSKAVFAYVIQVYDNRKDVFPESIANDTFVNFASVPLAKNTRYASLSPFSQSIVRGGNIPQLTFFRAHITGNNLLNLINDLKLQTPEKDISENPADYAVLSFGVITEVFVGTNSNTNISMASRITELSAYEFY